MIYICTSMYMEAEPFIKNCNLKKDLSFKKFQIFKNDNMILLITGIGKIKAAIGVTYMLSKLEINHNDFLINFGLCGTKNEAYNLGDTFICNKIIDNDTKKTFYPDILFKHDFFETSIESFSNVVNDINLATGNLIDMEASSIYESALTFLQPHQVFFIKVISDYLNTSNLNQNDLWNYLNESSIKVIEWINPLSKDFEDEKCVFSIKEKDLLNCVSDNLKFSATMKNEMIQSSKYFKLSHKSFEDIIKPYEYINCKSKKEGKIYLEEIKQKLI